MSQLGRGRPEAGSPFRRAVVAQVGGVLMAAISSMVWPEASALTLAFVHGLCAAGVACLWRLPSWWWLISFLFAPSALLAQRLALPSWAWLAAFVIMLLVFWRTDTSRVPLYMTNTRSAEAIAALLPTSPGRFIDLGCGDGSLLRHLARARPDWQFVGFEHAPLTLLWARVMGWAQPNLRLCYGNFWGHDLSGYHCVYAFLSPVPMARLWGKACAEMQPNALLISNSFAVDGVEPTSFLQVRDRRQTCLYTYYPAERAVTT